MLPKGLLKLDLSGCGLVETPNFNELNLLYELILKKIIRDTQIVLYYIYIDLSS